MWLSHGRRVPAPTVPVPPTAFGDTNQSPGRQRCEAPASFLWIMPGEFGDLKLRGERRVVVAAVGPAG